MESKIRLSLLTLRLSVFLVMFMWTIDKFLNPDHAKQVFAHFYFLGNLEAWHLNIIGAAQMLIIMGFLIGFKRKWTYGLVFIMHLISTLSSYKQYFNPFEGPSLLFFAAWPMLAAIFTLYILRDYDQLCVIGAKKAGPHLG